VNYFRFPSISLAVLLAVASVATHAQTPAVASVAVAPFDAGDRSLLVLARRARTAVSGALAKDSTLRVIPWTPVALSRRASKKDSAVADVARYYITGSVQRAGRDSLVIVWRGVNIETTEVVGAGSARAPRGEEKRLLESLALTLRSPLHRR
jgi:hypothetical protein